MHELPNTKALIAVVGGDAIAAGQHTLTSGLVHNFAEDRGGYSIAMGEAVFEASAQSPAQGGAAAAATTFLDVSGADFVIEIHSEHEGADRNHAWADSELDYVAIDIDGWSPPGGPVVIELPQPGNHLQPCWHEPPHGNNGYVLGMAEAHGAGRLAHGGAAATETASPYVSGADFVIEMHSDHQDADRNHAWASSELDYVAIVIDGWSPPAGPVVIDPPQPGNHLQPCWHEPLSAHVPIDVNGWSPRGGPVVIAFPQSGDHLLSHTHEPPHGNNADVLAMAEAHGAGSLSATLTNALTIENHFSFVNASAMVVI